MPYHAVVNGYTEIFDGICTFKFFITYFQLDTLAGL